MEHDRKPNAYVGRPIERIEDLRFLRGRGQYVDDLTREGLLHAVILRSSVAHGRIRAIDTAAARARPGVHAVITAADIGDPVPVIPMRQEPLPALKQYLQPVIAHDKVRYVGEPMAVVVADSAAIAEDALEAIEVDIEPLPAVADRDAARAGNILLFEAAGTNLASTITAVRGDADAAFRNAPYVRRERFKVQRHAAVPDGAARPAGGMGCRATADDRVRRRQGPLPQPAHAGAHDGIGRAIRTHGGIRRGRRFWRARRVLSGGFSDPVRGEAHSAARSNGSRTAARTCSPPTTRATPSASWKSPATRDGTILGLRGRAFTDLGAYLRTVGATASRNITQVMSGPYRIPNIHIDVSLLMTNKTPSGTYRGPGRFEADFFRERLLDMAARDLGIDRVEFRRRNLISEAEMPYPLAKVLVLDIETECDSGDYQVTLDRCLSEFDWAGKVQSCKGA